MNKTIVNKTIVKKSLTRMMRTAAVTVLAMGASVCTTVCAALPAHADDRNPADPALQQVVKENEAVDMDTPVVIQAKHVDIAPRLNNGKWVVMARDDTKAPPVWRPLSKIVFWLGDASLQKLPENGGFDFIAAKPGSGVYTVPQTEIAGVPWLGWSTQDPNVVKNVNGQVKITFEGHQGPGQFVNFLQEGLGASAKPLFTSDNKSAQTINVDINTHTHTNWVFTEPGTHLVKVTFSATLKDGSAVTDSQVVRFAVGPKADTAAAETAQWKGVGPAASALAKSEEGDGHASSGMVMYVAIGALVLGLLAVAGAIVVSSRAKALRASARADVNAEGQQ